MMMAKVYNLETQIEFIKSENKHLKEEKEQKRNQIYQLKQQMRMGQYNHVQEDEEDNDDYVRILTNQKMNRDDRMYDMPDRLEKSQY